MLQDVWDKQSRWSQAADELKRQVTKARAMLLGFAIVGAVLSTLGAVLGLDTVAGKVCAFVAAAAAGLAAIAAGFAGRQGLEPWTRARSVSEAIKSEVYTYLPRAGDYAKGNADARLLDRIKGFEDDAAELAATAQRQKPVERQPPVVANAAAYGLVRAKQQKDDYYLKNVKKLDHRIRSARRAEVALGIVGALLAAAAGTWEIDELAVWVPVVTTITAAIATHVAAERWTFLQLEYSRTALQIERLISALNGGQITPDRFILDCEEVISTQNSAWMAKLAQP